MKEEKEYPDILKRLKEFMEHKQLSAYQINKDAGLSKGLITNSFSKGLGLTSSTISSLLLAYPELNANWLLVGRGPMLLNDDASSGNLASGNPASTASHLQDLQQLQDSCVELVKQIQLMKQREQTLNDNNLLQTLMH